MRYDSLDKICASEALSFKPLRVCILTQDVFGPIRNGGIGTAYGHVANFLAEQGHDVTILYTLGSYCENGKISDWIDYYAKKGITFVPAPECEVAHIRDPMRSQLVIARRAYEALRDMEPFELVHVSEWSGNAYYALQAKRLGLGFKDTIFCVKTSSPHLWDYEGNNKPITTMELLAMGHLEQKSVEWADFVISPSQHMLQWMAEHGYDLPKGRMVVNPNIMPLPEDWAEIQGRPMELDRVSELVFFGRLDKRKGIDIFAEAIGLLIRDGMLPEDIAITFLGKRSSLFDSEANIASWSGEWGRQVTTLTDRNAAEAIEYLKGKGRLAVVPSRLDNSPFTIYECLAHRIPFLTTDQGGTPELVHEEDHARTIFTPRPAKLAALLDTVIREGAIVGRPSFDLEGNLDIWAKFHVALAHDKSIIPAPNPPVFQYVESESPLVSVCIAHYNRPDLLPQALDSIRRQTYENLEVVLVDDGSTNADALAYLESLEPEFASRNWQLVRQENQYLGAVRNTSAAHARGEFLLLMDDDNVAKPHEVETFVQCALHSGADILTCFGDVLDTLDAPDEDYRSPRRITYLGDNLSLGLLINCFGDSNSLVRKSVFDKVTFTEDYGIGHDDQDFFARAILSGHTLQTVPEALYWYRVIGDRMTDDGEMATMGLQRVLRGYLTYVPPEFHGIVRLATAQGRLGIPTDCLTWRLADGARRMLVRIPGMERVLLSFRSFWASRLQKVRH